MQALREAIARQGIGIGTDVVKVDGFLNHRIDVALTTAMGQAFYEAFRDQEVDAILTVEASGIAVAFAAAQAFGNIPVIFAKKADHRNVGPEVYTAKVYSFTHQKMSLIRVGREYLIPGMRVLIIDDFLANGEAINGLRSIVAQAGCILVGAGVCVEKTFQPGGARLREEGVRLVSLAQVEAVENGKIRLREE